MSLAPILLSLAWGTFFILRSSWLSKQNAAYLRRVYAHELRFPALWPYVFRAIGVAFVGWGIVMLIRR